MLLQTVAETKPWHNQQVLGGFFASSGGACPPVGLCSWYSWGRGATAFPPHPQDFSCLQMLK